MWRRARSLVAVVSLTTLCAFAHGASTFYLPGTGQAIQHLDFEDATLKSQSFDYGSGWAGTGFGLSGTQRGAPEVTNVKDNPSTPAGAGTQGLSFNSQSRDAAWYTANPSAVGTNVYGGPDGENQDDFFMYSSGWTANQTPSVMMRVWLPTSATYSSLRMTTKYDNSGVPTNSWPGMWLYHDRISFRGPGRPDINIQVDDLFGLTPAEQTQSCWWTLGLSVTPIGDLQYYATPDYVMQFVTEYHVGNNSDLSAAAGVASNFLLSNNDAIIMSSNRNSSANDQTFIDNFLYTRNTPSVTAPDIGGDFDFDGSVDGLDFLLWQQGLSPQPFSDSDLDKWEANYGVTSGIELLTELFPSSGGVPSGWTPFVGTGGTPPTLSINTGGNQQDDDGTQPLTGASLDGNQDGSLRINSQSATGVDMGAYIDLSHTMIEGEQYSLQTRFFNPNSSFINGQVTLENLTDGSILADSGTLLMRSHASGDSNYQTVFLDYTALASDVGDTLRIRYTGKAVNSLGRDLNIDNLSLTVSSIPALAAVPEPGGLA